MGREERRKSKPNLTSTAISVNQYFFNNSHYCDIKGSDKFTHFCSWSCKCFPFSAFLSQECTSPNEGRQNLYSWDKWQHIPVFLPGKFEGLGSLAGYSPRGHKRVGQGLAAWQFKMSHTKRTKEKLLKASNGKSIPF